MAQIDTSVENFIIVKNLIGESIDLNNDGTFKEISGAHIPEGLNSIRLTFTDGTTAEIVKTSVYGWSTTTGVGNSANNSHKVIKPKKNNN